MHRTGLLLQTAASSALQGPCCPGDLITSRLRQAGTRSLSLPSRVPFSTVRCAGERKPASPEPSMPQAASGGQRGKPPVPPTGERAGALALATALLCGGRSASVGHMPVLWLAPPASCSPDPTMSPTRSPVPVIQGEGDQRGPRQPL